MPGDAMLDPVDQRRVILETAAAALADIRTVQRVLAGKPVRGHVGDRIRRALAERGVRAAESHPKTKPCK